MTAVLDRPRAAFAAVTWYRTEFVDAGGAAARGSARAAPLVPPGLGLDVAACVRVCSTPRLLAGLMEAIVEKALARFGAVVASAAAPSYAELEAERALEPSTLSLGELHGLLSQLDALIAQVRESLRVLVPPRALLRAVCSAPRVSFPSGGTLRVHMLQAAADAPTEAPAELPSVTAQELFDDTTRALAHELVRRAGAACA